MSPKNRAKARMPCTRSLLESIESLNKATKMVRTSRINKTRGLAHINLLFQNTMKEVILDIQLAERPSSCNSQRE
jgi:F0F1-type ATP synthase gamma subunit